MGYCLLCGRLRTVVSGACARCRAERVVRMLRRGVIGFAPRLRR